MNSRLTPRLMGMALDNESDDKTHTVIDKTLLLSVPLTDKTYRIIFALLFDGVLAVKASTIDMVV